MEKGVSYQHYIKKNKTKQNKTKQKKENVTSP